LTRLAAFACALILSAGLSNAQEHAQLDTNETLFSVMAAVNAGLPDPNPAVRDHLAGRTIPVLSQLRNFVDSHRKNGQIDWSAYISLALTSEGAPDFKPMLTGLEEPPDLPQLEGFRELLIRFYREAALNELWRKMEPTYQAEVTRYHEPVTRTLAESNGYFRSPTSGYLGRRFFVYVEMLAPANQVHTRSYKDDYFVVVAGAAQPRIPEVRHLYLHYLLDPITAKFSDVVMKRSSLRDFALGAAGLDEIYKSDFLLLTTECLIRAIETRMDRKPAGVQESLAEGFILTPFFAESLPAYEKQESAMRLFFPELMEMMDVKKEIRRLDAADLTVAPPKKPSAPVERVPEAPREAAMVTIDAAEKLYEGRDLEKAAETFRRALQQTDKHPLHARSYYGLARIAALQRNPELAEQLFRKTLELSPDPHTHAWSEVYLGRLALATAAPDEAAAHFKAALAVEGATERARQAAQEGLSKTSK
jgi:tetratricopeptide (TPR) repeat protein